MCHSVPLVFSKQALNRALVEEQYLPQQIAIKLKCLLFVGTVPYGRRPLFRLQALRSTQFPSSFDVWKFLLQKCVTFEVYRSVKVLIIVFRVVTPHGLKDCDPCVGGPSCYIMGAEGPSETPLTNREAARCCNT